ncbi:MAG: PAC2 family protein, partial [Chloroflexota bacterium]
GGFYDLTTLRPRVRMDNGVVRRLRFPTNEFYFYESRGQGHDLVLFSGVEPHYRWRSYIEHITAVAEKFGVEKGVTLGGIYDQVPHSRPPRISAAVSNPELRQGLEDASVSLVTYEGPSSIQTSLLMALQQKGIEAMGLWASAPYYIQLPNAKVCYGLLLRLSQMLNLSLDLEGLTRQARFVDFQLSQAVEGYPELAEHVKELEVMYDAGGEPFAESLQDEGLISEIENFLRQPKKED